MKKSAIITFLSKITGEAKEVEYRVEGSDPVSGKRTNDAPVKHLFRQSVQKGNAADKIVCIVSQEVCTKNSGEAYSYFQEMVEKEVSCEISVDPIPYDFEGSPEQIIKTISTQQGKALSVYRGISKALDGYDEVYIDYTGGLRDTSFLMTVLIRYLEFTGVTCKDIVYSNYYDVQLCSLSYIYDMFKLLNAVSQFVETGSGKLLKEVYDDINPIEHEPTRNLVECINEFSEALHLCNVSEIDRVVGKMTEAIQTLEAEYKCWEDDKSKKMQEKDIRVHMFQKLLQVIKKKFYIEGERGFFTYPKLIEWCIDNDLLQQALTLYVEKMPEVYYKKDLIKKLPETGKRGRGESPEVFNFYTILFKDILDKTASEKIKVFQSNIDEVITQRSKKGKYATAIEEVWKKCTDEKIVRALKRVKDYLEEHYMGADYETKKSNGCVWGVLINNKKGENLINELKHKLILGYAFLSDNESEFEGYKKQKKFKGENESENNDLYANKIMALRNLSKLDDISAYTKLPKEQLTKIMSYYLAVKYLRNEINHASYMKESRDEGVEGYLKENGIEIDMKVKNIEKILKAGLDITESCEEIE